MSVVQVLLLFNVILRFMGDPSVGPFEETVMGSYLIQRCLFNEGLRDEILCMIVNQTWLNPNDINCERGWTLMALCLRSVDIGNKGGGRPCKKMRL
jgi:hypothetical protein